MKKGKTCLPLFLLLAAVSMLPGASVRAASADRIRKEIQYSTTNKEEKRETEFPEEIKEEGRTYRRGRVEYQVLKEEPVTEKKTVFLTKKSGELEPDEEYSPPQDITENGIRYGYLDQQKKMVTKRKGYTQTVTGFSLYGSRAGAQGAPATKRIRAVDPQTKEAVTVTCRKKGGVKKTADTWEDTYIDILFVAYDARHFIWNGIQVEKDEQEPLRGYEKELLESVGGSEADHRIRGISWNGKSYRDRNGVLCRRARADVRKRVSHYRVDYAGTRTVKPERRVVYTCTYIGEKKEGTGEVRYTILAKASYEEEKPGRMPVLVITVGVVFALAAAAGILLLLARRGKKKKGTVDKEK